MLRVEQRASFGELSLNKASIQTGVVEYQLTNIFFNQMTEIDFTEDKENFKWKGHGPLLPKEGSISVPPGFKLQSGLQLIPAAPVSALVVETHWGLLAAGTVHGFILYDYINKKTATTKWTVSQGKVIGFENYISKISLKAFLWLLPPIRGEATMPSHWVSECNNRIQISSADFDSIASGHSTNVLCKRRVRIYYIQRLKKVMFQLHSLPCKKAHA